MNRLSFLTDFAQDNRHYDSDKEIHAVLSNTASNLFSKLKAIRHPNVSQEHLSKALSGENKRLKNEAIMHPNVSKAHLEMALTNDFLNMKDSAIQNPEVTKEQIDRALGDDDKIIRIHAIQHPNVTPEHITKALTMRSHVYDPVRRAAMDSPKATTEHFIMALRDPDYYVQHAAKSRLNRLNNN